jgi:hypothetical protein
MPATVAGGANPVHRVQLKYPVVRRTVMARDDATPSVGSGQIKARWRLSVAGTEGRFCSKCGQSTSIGDAYYRSCRHRSADSSKATSEAAKSYSTMRLEVRARIGLSMVTLLSAIAGVLLLTGCGGSSGLSSSSTCLEWGNASTKERDTYAPGSVPPETVTEHQGGESERQFGPFEHLTESEPAQKITHECEAGRDTGSEPHSIGEAG